MAAYGGLPRQAKAANAAGWDSGAKDSDISILSGFMGATSGAQNTTTSSFGGIRSTWNASSGKYMFVVTIAAQAAAGQNHGVGICNSSASMTNAEIGNTGTNSAGQLSTFLYYNSSSTGSTSGFGVGTLSAVAIDATSATKKLYFRMVTTTADSGWKDMAWSAADPTNNATGWTIPFAGAYYFMSTLHVTGAGGTYRQWLNQGGWPIIDDYTPLPSGYTMADANYPYTYPVGTVTLNSTTGTGANRSLSNMRLAVDTTLPNSGECMAYSSTRIPASSKVVFAVYWDIARDIGRMMMDNDGTITNAFAWNSTTGAFNCLGTTSGTTPGLLSGGTSLLAYNATTKKAWISVDNGTTWYGAGTNTTGDPAAGTNGIDLSAATGGTSFGPGIMMSTGSRCCGTFNAGAMTDAAVTLPSGFQWLEAASAASPRSRAVIIQ